MVRTKKPIVYFIGIGGIGMSALARWFLAQKWSVFGSDMIESATIGELRKEGIKARIGQKKGHIPPSTSLVVYTAAIPSNHRELRLAKKLHIPAVSYAQLLGFLTDQYRTISIAGSHGKSTTTSLMGLMLLNAGLDPTIIVGTKLKELHGRNFHAGKSEILVLESDEYNRSFLAYRPTIIVITNIDREHLDTYGTLANLKKSFLQFIGNIRNGGALVLNRDDAHLYALRNKIGRIAKRNNARLYWYALRSAIAPRIERALRIPGRHNLSNAIAAHTVAQKILGVSERHVLDTLRNYSGAWRRMEYKGIARINHSPAAVYDDYAHHPTEVRATLRALREKYPRRYIVCAYQPHQAKRLAAQFKEFVHAFNDADMTVLLPVYEVPGRDRASRTMTSKTLSLAMARRAKRTEVHYLPHPRMLKTFLAKHIPSRSPSPGPIVVMMGAGDIVDYTPSLFA